MGRHRPKPPVMPALSSARSSLVPLVLLLAMWQSQGLVPQSKQASRLFSDSSAIAAGAQQTCRTNRNTRRPATAEPTGGGAGSRTGNLALLSASADAATAADGNAAQDVRQVCVEIRNTAIFSPLHSRKIPRSALVLSQQLRRCSLTTASVSRIPRHGGVPKQTAFA